MLRSTGIPASTPKLLKAYNRESVIWKIYAKRKCEKNKNWKIKMELKCQFERVEYFFRQWLRVVICFVSFGKMPCILKVFVRGSFWLLQLHWYCPNKQNGYWTVRIYVFRSEPLTTSLRDFINSFFISFFEFPS